MKMNKIGISLIVLVITIVIMIILASVIILSVTQGGIIESSKEAVFKSDIKNYINELEVYKSDLEIKNKIMPDIILRYPGTGDTKGTIKEIFPEMENKYAKNFQIMGGKLIYVGGDLDQLKWIGEIGGVLLPFELSDDGKKIISTKDFVGISGKLVIPEYIEAIEASAFYNNKNITEVDFSKNNKISEIPFSTFKGCTNLKQVKFSDSLITIGMSAFEDCVNLNNVVIPNNLENIGGGAFYMCTSLTNLSFSNNNKIKTIYGSTFSNTKLINISLPSSLEIIGSGAFASNSNLVKVSIGEQVSSIDSGAFGNCPNLENIEVSSKNLKYETYDGCLYTKGLDTLVQVPSGKDTINISDKTSTIMRSSFSAVNKLTSINIPSSVMSMSGSPGFRSCSLLSSINVAANNPKYMVIDNILYEKDTSNNPIKAIDCIKNISNVVIPSTVTEISNAAFRATNIQSVDMSSSLVTKISSDAFWGCNSLGNVKFSSNLERIEELAFYACAVLNNINIPASVTSINAIAFVASPKLNNFSIDENNAKYKYINGAIYSKDGKTMVSLLNIHTEFNIPDGVENLGALSCSYARALKKITIPSSVKKIGQQAFQYDTSLTTITIPSSVIEVGTGIFNSCLNLKEIKIEKPKDSLQGAPWEAPYGITAVKWQQ